MAAVAGVIGALGSIASGVLGFGQAKYQQEVAKNNAIIARQNAMRTIEASQREEQDVAHQGAGMVGELVAAQSASGVALGSGSAPLVRSHAAKLARMDVLRTREAGEREAYNYLVDAANFKSQAAMAGMEGTANLLGGFLGGASSLIGGSSSVRDRRRFY